MKLKNGTHISGGKNCCAKTVYTGDVIHVSCTRARSARAFESGANNQSTKRPSRMTHPEDLPEAGLDGLRHFVHGLRAVDHGHA